MKYVESKLFGFLHSYESECMKERYYTFRRYVNQIKAKGDHLNIVLSRIDNGFHSLNSIQLSLDIFTFFIFFRVLLDDVAKMTRYLYPKNIADQLPTSFSDLGRNKILKEHDEEFAFFLNKKISTLFDLIDTRDGLVHHLDQIIPLPQGKQIMILRNVKGKGLRLDFDKRIDRIIEEFKSLQEFYIDHFSQKVKEHCPDFRICPRPVKMPSELAKFFI